MADLPRHCSPGCRWCEATERIAEMIPPLEAAGRADIAYMLFDLAEIVGQKDQLGTRLTNVLLGAPDA